eukprot:4992119-Alexandrium_andersonii.AAC.1
MAAVYTKAPSVVSVLPPAHKTGHASCVSRTCTTGCIKQHASTGRSSKHQTCLSGVAQHHSTA